MSSRYRNADKRIDCGSVSGQDFGGARRHGMVKSPLGLCHPSRAPEIVIE
jgi:hypothetical protein